MQESYEEKVEKCKKVWNNFSSVYYSLTNRSSLCLMNNLMSLTRISQKSTIIDCGCGPGLGTKLLTLDIPKYSTVYSIDLSTEMIKYCNQVFSDYDDFNSNLNNYWEISKFTNEKINILEDTKEIRKTKSGKIVKFYEGNAEYLLFEDKQFDAYLGSLLLMLCTDTDKAISESYRVLKDNGIAAFSIWGKKTNSKLVYHLFNNEFIKFGYSSINEKSSFWLSENEDELKNRFLKVGFREVRMGYTNQLYDCYDVDDFMLRFAGPSVQSKFDMINDPIIQNQILNNVKDEVKIQILENKILPVLNILIVVAFK